MYSEAKEFEGSFKVYVHLCNACAIFKTFCNIKFLKYTSYKVVCREVLAPVKLLCWNIWQQTS